MKFQYNQLDLSFNTSTKFHQNPSHSYRDISAMFSDKTYSDKWTELKALKKN